MRGCAPIFKLWAASRKRQQYAIFQKDPLVVAGFVEDIADAVKTPALLEYDPHFTGVEPATLLSHYQTAWKDIHKEVQSENQQPPLQVCSQQDLLPDLGERKEQGPTKKCIVCHKNVAPSPLLLY